jgi:hypothetical protein
MKPKPFRSPRRASVRRGDSRLFRKCAEMASADISRWVTQTYEKFWDGEGDTWVCCGKWLFTQQNKSLNRQLGLHRLNKHGYTPVHKRRITWLKPAKRYKENDQ